MSKKRLLLIILLVFTLLSAGVMALLYQFWLPDTENRLSVEEKHNLLLTEVSAIGKMELVKYRIRDIVEYKIPRQYAPLDPRPDPEVILIVAGEVTGCIDLTKLKTQDITQSGEDTLYIKLPAPEICYVKIDHKKSRLYDTKTSIFDEEGHLVDAAYKAAERRLEESDIQTEVLMQTRQNALSVLQPILEKITAKTVFIQFHASEPLYIKKK